jgi:hypothetical protein
MFVCSVGDEVATQDDQIRAKNDRQALVAKYRKLQAGLHQEIKAIHTLNIILFLCFAEFDNLAAKKNADLDILTQKLRDVTEQKSKSTQIHVYSYNNEWLTMKCYNREGHA